MLLVSEVPGWTPGSYADLSATAYVIYFGMDRRPCRTWRLLVGVPGLSGLLVWVVVRSAVSGLSDDGGVWLVRHWWCLACPTSSATSTTDLACFMEREFCLAMTILRGALKL